MSSPDAPIRRGEQAVFRDLGEGQGGVILHLGSGQYHGLNATGCIIWDLIDGRRTTGELAAALRERELIAP